MCAVQGFPNFELGRWAIFIEPTGRMQYIIYNNMYVYIMFVIYNNADMWICFLIKEEKHWFLNKYIIYYIQYCIITLYEVARHLALLTKCDPCCDLLYVIEQTPNSSRLCVLSHCLRFLIFQFKFIMRWWESEHYIQQM